jgi:outer membrane protein insertion porin family
MKQISPFLTIRSLATVLLASTAIAAPGLALAQQAPPDLSGVEQPVLVNRIEVRGNERIPEQSIISYLPIQLGTLVTREQLDLAIESLYARDLFSNIAMSVEPGTTVLIVEVEENPIINRVIFEGNSAIREERLTDEVSARPRGIFTPARVQQDVERLIEVYRQSGRISATITPEIIEREQRRVDLIFRIEEGPKSGILDVNFLGNQAYSDRELSDVILTERSAWWKFFSSNTNYDPDRVDFDVTQLSDFYRDRGYFNFRVESTAAELRLDRNGFAVTFTLDEGDQYTFGDVSVDTELNRLDGEVLERLLPINTGDLYRRTAIEEAQDYLIFSAGSVGFAFVDIIPEEIPNPQTNTVDVVFHVVEGPRVYVERIDIVGNTQTRDKVIRRELELVEGDAFNRGLVDRSLNNIRALRFFAEPSIEDLPGSAPDRAVLRVQVEEQPTGELAFAAGYSSVDQLVIDFSVTQRNFRGRGQDVRAQVRTGSFQQIINFSFTEPRFRDRNLSVGIDLYSFNYDFSREANYETTQTGTNLELGFPLSQSSYLNLVYSLRGDNISVPAATCIIANPTLCQQLGTKLTSLVGATMTISRTNDPIRPTRGYNFAVSQSLAGLGGETKFVRTEMQGSWYYGFSQDFILTLRGSAGYVDAYDGETLRISDRFFKGGNTFRGFETAGIGPRDTTFNSALGGKIYGIGTVELTVPTFLPEQFGIEASLFTDFGTLGGIDRADKIQCTESTPPVCRPNAAIEDDFGIRAASGISIGWDSPLGPIQFDISKVIAKEDYDRTESFRFSTRREF